MSLAGIWSGNFYHLRNSLGSNCRFKVLRLQPGPIPTKVGSASRTIFRPLRTKVEARDGKSQIRPCNININNFETVGPSTNTNTNRSKLFVPEVAQRFDLRENIPDRKIIDRPATFIVFDIETTGFSRKTERIIEIALRDLIGGKNSTFETLVRPDKDIPNSYIHGISNHMVNKPDVPRFGELIPILMEFVWSRQRDGKPIVLVAHNGRTFDIPFIISEFSRCSMEIPADWLFVDTIPLARQLVKPDGTKLDKWSLKALREHYNVPLVGPAHRAMQDVITLSHVFQRITFDLKLTTLDIIGRAFRASDIAKRSR